MQYLEDFKRSKFFLIMELRTWPDGMYDIKAKVEPISILEQITGSGVDLVYGWRLREEQRNK